MKTFSYLSAGLLFCILISCSGTPTGVKANESLSDDDQEILRMIHNAELSAAETKINKLIAENPNNLRAHFFKTSMYFHARYFSSPGAKRDSIASIFLESCETAIAQAEQQTETLERQFYMGSFYSFKSRALLSKQEWTSAFFAARTGKKLLESVIEAAPDYADAYLPLGILYYFASTQQAWWQGALAWITDLDVPKEKALKYIHTAYDQGLLNKNEALFVLCNVNSFMENKFDVAEVQINAYNSQFPSNRFFIAPLNSLRLSRVVEEKGGEYLLSNLDSLATVYPMNGMQSLNRVGYQFLGQKKFPDALAVFQANVKLFPESANSHDSLAECYYMMGQMHESKKYYDLALAKVNEDKTIGEDFRKSLREGIESKLKELASY